MTTKQKKTLEQLADEWKAAKEEEREASTKRLAVEADFLTAMREAEIELPEAGTLNVGAIKIETGFNPSWDQDELDQIYKRWPHTKVPFPFKSEYKPESIGIKFIKEHKADLWERLEVALTLKARKPAFSINGVSTVRDLKSR